MIQETHRTVEYTLPLANNAKSGPMATSATATDVAVSLPAIETNGIILSGTQVVWGCFSALSFVGLLLWAILKLWVYE